MPAKTKEKEKGPPINAASKDEEKFILYVVHTLSLDETGDKSFFVVHADGRIETSWQMPMEETRKHRGNRNQHRPIGQEL